MKSQIRAFHQKTLLRALHSVALFILLTFNSLCLKAQIDCNQSLSPSFPLGGSPQTLCERYAIPGSFPYQFGASNTVYASQIMSNINNGNNVFTGDIDLVGDLIIDEDFTLLNCKIRISPDVKIRVWADVTLTLDGSKLFCCQMMWQGIDLDNRSSIITKNISEIEDSEIAIESRCSATLSIRNTIFNLNEVGIRLGYDGPLGPHPCPTLPVFTQFSGNTFQCNLPLNGTTDEVGFAGIQVYKTNATIGSLTSSINTFRNIRYGIRYESQYWWGTSSVNRCRFEDILDDGIHLKRGNLTVDRCIFTNCGFRGINVISTSGLIVQRSNFNYTDNIPNSLVSNAVYRHIEATGFGVNCEVNINHNTFRGNFTDPINLENIRGIELRGGITMGSGTNILIDRNNFIFIYEQDGFSDISYEILLNGEFPTTTSTTVQFNNFFLDQPTGQVALSGLNLANGNKNNVKIYSNYFDSGSRGPFTTATVDRGIGLNGSMGSGNEISGNIFTPNLNTLFSNNFSSGLHSQDFLNAVFCENNLRESGLPMVFQGASMGTQCIGNTVTGGGTSFLVQEGYIGEQGIEGGTHFGNKWYDKWPNVTPTDHARHVPIALAPNSRIWVNTPQSILDPQGPGYTFFSQFHPANIDPDQNDEWVKEDPLGTVTASECVNFAVISTSTDKAIASGSINTLIQNPTLIWT
ncbi:MAG: right-handed parallel beta-helix repeat-containing protein, partial [Saprospiraceae bacterium]|nr:right-handed parallel beta-helix repeat-containing protein [Saprospiraceae bacterium]